MIIKSTRIPTRHTSRIERYLKDPGPNEVSSWLRGCPSDLMIMGEISRLACRQFAVRHFIIAPGEPMNHLNFRRVFREICLEYKISTRAARRIAVVQHTRQRLSGEGNEIHWHLASPEFDTETHRTMSSKFFKIRNEKVARICELVLGHPIVLGRFNRQVYQALEKERPELDLMLFEAALRDASAHPECSNKSWLDFRAKGLRNPKNTEFTDLPKCSFG